METKSVDPDKVAELLGRDDVGDWPGFDSSPMKTPKTNQSYFVKPGVVMLARTAFSVEPLEPFLSGFDPSLEFQDYIDDDVIGVGGEDGAELIKAAGQTCYMSFGKNRSKNKDAQKYIDNILSSGHGSVLEHAQYTFLIWGIGRDFTHELVRHRVGVAFSQVSQRYVDGKVLRFVERPEYQQDEVLHGWFEERIERTAEEYNKIAARLLERQTSGAAELSGEKKTELRKKVNQAARSCLPNETEAPIVFSGNVRALRHIVEMRASGVADVPIREVTTRIFLAMRSIEPTLFNDYKLFEVPGGTYAVATDWRKV